MQLISRAEAKAAGLPRYFTGKPCKRGHVCERVTANGACRLCSNAASAACHRADPEKRRANQNAWRAANRDYINAYERERCKRNPEQTKARHQRFSAKNAPYRRAYHETNAEKIRRRVREWCLTKPGLARAIKANYRARKASAEGKHTAAEVRALLEKQGGRCAYCRTSIRDGFHADHIQPLKRGGSNWIKNIQLTCAPCNTRKNAADPTDFARRVGLLI